MIECVLFDFDNTLTRRDTTQLWLRAFARVHPFKAVLNLLHVFRVWKAKRRPELLQEAKFRMFGGMLKGLSPEELTPVNLVYARAVRKNLRPVVWSALEKHLQAGRRILVVTASPRCAVESVFASTKVETLGTEFAVKCGRFTGELEGAGCHGSAKIAAIDAWSAEKPEPVAFVEAWSDSLSDSPMLFLAPRRCWICPPAQPSEVLASDPSGMIVRG